MTKPKDPPLPDDVAEAQEEAPPCQARIGVTPPAICERLRIVDAETGDQIEKVIEADAETGRVVRYAVEGGNLVREGDRMKVIEEERKIRIEWRTGKQKDSF